MGIKFTIESVEGGIFFFKGTAPDGTDFCGTADDMNTAYDMVKDCLWMIMEPLPDQARAE